MYEIKKDFHPLSPQGLSLRRIARPLELMPDLSIVHLSIVHLSKDLSVFLLKSVCAVDDRLALTKHALEKGIGYSGTSGKDKLNKEKDGSLLGFTRINIHVLSI